MDSPLSEAQSEGRSRSLSDPAPPGRRKCISGGWFKRLGQKISGGEQPRASSTSQPVDVPPRRASAASVNTTTSMDSDERQRAHSFKDELLKFGRKGSVDQRGAGSPPPLPAGSESLFDDMKRASRTRSRSSVHAPKAGTTSTEDLVDPLASSPEKPKEAKLSPPPVSSLKDLEAHGISTRHVGFALSTFANDPPQRIPPMKPSKGNVEFARTGELLVSPRPRHYQSTDTPYLERNHRELSTSAQSRAHQNAERLHNTIASGGGGGISSLLSGFGQKAAAEDLEQEEVLNRSLADHDVDGTRKSAQTMGNASEWVAHTQDSSKPFAPDQVYVRCCHLREIMPIRNILRQLQGQTAPIPRLRIANTKPTLVEVQAFSDFLTVVPVAAMALDNHVMDAEMIRLLLSGLTRSRDIARLTLTNTDLDDEAWMYLCSFLASSRKTLMALSLSCTDPTGVPERVKAFNRRNRNWKLLTEALAAMGSLEELDLSGTGIPMEDLDHLIHTGFKNGRLLGLANSGLSFPEVKQVANWLNEPSSKLMGLNLSGNNMSQDKDLSVIQSLLTNPRLLQLSLRNASLTQAHADQFVSQVTPERAALSSLRQLDLSLNPRLFPVLMNRLVESLSRFPFLSRLHLDHCGLTSDAIIMLCEALSHCHKLVFVSFVGNGKITETAATAVCVAVYQSRSICTVEADMQDWPPTLRQQLAKYCIQNLERSTGALVAPPTPQEDENEDISSFYEELRAVTRNFQNLGEELDSGKALRQIDEMRKALWKRVQALLMRRQERPLSVSEREALVRLYFYGNSLDRLQKQVTGASPTAGGDVEEAVKNVEENDFRPAPSRTASQASIRSLKKLEREEGVAHKRNTERLSELYSTFDKVAKLHVHDLEKIIN